ncbi:hypothetical protein RIF29_20016 [Crotalaria pallida]|uniref:Uncharacterized protein n=1 Tax=Crotalaria pallida TaxID=3830 RepID=A0AAN9F0E2_CROPI
MVRKKGRPPKSPSPHPSPTPNTIPKNIDLLNLDEEDMEDIEDLSPKKAGSILKKLDELRAKIKGKAIVEEEGEGMNKELITLNIITQNTSTQSPDPAFLGEQPRRASIWDSKQTKKVWVEKRRPSREDIEKVDDALRLKKQIEEGKIPEANIGIATEAVKEALKDKCGEEEEEVSVVKETQPERMDKEQEGQNEKDKKEDQWTPVMTRRKGQDLMEIGVSMMEKWVLLGDFNCCLNIQEKLGGHQLDYSQIEGFRDFVFHCQLEDMKYGGCFYTWNNRQEGEDRIFSKLDRVLVNEEWCRVWPEMQTEFINNGTSDHIPMVVKWSTNIAGEGFILNRNRLWRLLRTSISLFYLMGADLRVCQKMK